MKGSAILGVAMLGLLLVGCEGAADKPAPVELVATVEQNLHVLDFTDAECGQVGTVLLRNIIKRPDVTTDDRFLDIRLTAYRVSYRRRDGGTLVPAPFTRSLSMLVPAGGTATEFGSFLIFEPASLNQAPFAALLPANGGIDPETGKRTVDMDVIIEFFGETLSGENVSARAQLGLTFCIGCGGCV